MASEEDLDPTVHVEGGGAMRDKQDADFSTDAESVIRIGRYMLVDRLGQGAFGVVFRARDESLERFVAIKLLTKFQSSSQVDAWIQEARVLAKLDHPSIVPVYDIGKTDAGQPFIVSKLIEGGDLTKRSSEPSWSLDDSVKAVTQLAGALDYLHRRGVMHRDVKPSNILTTEARDAVLVDFGLALAENTYGRGARFVGTPAYMSPEQARYEGHRVDGRSDIYSLGVVLYELLTGSRPFVAKDQEELLECIRNVEVRPLRQINSSVPKELERICLKALSKKVSDRYPTASDMAEDLVHWRSASLGTLSAPVQAAKPISTGSAADGQSTQKSIDIETVGVVPHGLRPFAHNDADFFRYLVPGARDRDGVPESISFWVQRMSSRDPNLTFRIGVLMGLSGSGKSSLIRAGVLPLVSEICTAVFVEAKPNDLEIDLVGGIHRMFPQFASELDLRELLIRIRSSGNPSRPKLVLVIDQFEQWLNQNRGSEITSLHEALRQCDGSNVQTLLLVRDDFMLGLSSFMDQLDESLLQNQNFATIEAFGVSHGRKVLGAFGRAFGTVSQPMTSAQEAFIDTAIDELANIGRLEPVQICLLSEMVKNKPWTTATLRELGGIQGLGISFLEERLTGTSAHPMLRSNLEIVKQILSELLPSDDTVIKPQACHQSILLERLEGLASEETLSRLLHLIDTEVRLITPSSNPNVSITSSSASSSKDPAYQLTHDYLVPTIRKWLASQNTSTREGRAAEQLRELSVLWNAKPTRKRLPSILEWTTIRWYVPKKNWSPNESRLMNAAGRDFLARGATIAAVLVVLVTGAWYWRKEALSRSLVTRLLEAKSEDVVTVLEEIQPHANWVIRKLPALSNKDDLEPKDEIEQFRISLAQVRQNPAVSDNVLDHLSLIEEQYGKPYINFLVSSSTLTDEAIASKAKTYLERENSTGVFLAALLCTRNSKHDLWRQLYRPLCKNLLSKNSVQLPRWIEFFRPIQNELVDELIALGEENEKNYLEDQSVAKQNLAILVTALASSDSKRLSRALTWIPIDSMPDLIKAGKLSKDFALELRELLAKESASDRPQRIRNPQAMDLEHEFRGQVYEAGGWLERIPLEKMESCLTVMKSVGLVPNSARHYTDKGQSFIASTWIASGSDSLVMVSLTSQEFEAQFASRQADGWALVDFSSYVWQDVTNQESDLRWIGVWRQSPELSNRQVLLLGETELDMSQQARLAKVGGLIQQRADTRLAANGELLHDSLWGQDSEGVEEQTRASRLEFAMGDLYPGYLQTDIRALYTLPARDRSRSWSEYYSYYLTSLRLQRRSPADLVLMASRLSACGELEKAMATFDEIRPDDWKQIREVDRASRKRTLYRFKGRTLAKLGRLEELKELVNEVASENMLPARDLDHLRLRVDLLEGNSSQVSKALDLLGKAQSVSLADMDVLLRSLGAISSSDRVGDLSTAAQQQLFELARRLPTEHRELLDTLLDSDFDALRANSEWLRLLDSLQLGTRYTSSYHASSSWESLALLGSSHTNHATAIDKLVDTGYLPTTLNWHSEPLKGPLFSSVWVRKKATLQEQSAKSNKIATICLAMAGLGELDALSDCVHQRWGKTAQTALIDFAPKILDSSVLVTMLKTESDSSALAILLSILANYRTSEFTDSDLRYVNLRLRDWSQSSKDAVLLNMATYCLAKIGEPLATNADKQDVPSGANWTVNSIGMQFVHIQAPEKVLVGKGEEKMLWTRIGRRFSISSKEVTGDQFAEFYRDPRFQTWMSENRQRRWCPLVEGNRPQHAVSWIVAVKYCQWLNEREKIPEQDWCYDNVWGEKDSYPVPKPDHLQLKGYRLPTEAEWSFACSGGSQDVWYFGNNETHTKYHEWTDPHAANTSHVVASLRPNPFGLFDMGGNLTEWTDSSFQQPLRPLHQYFVEDKRDATGERTMFFVLAGGRFKQSALSSATSTSTVNAPEYYSITTGFRLARTIEAIDQSPNVRIKE
ncbi:MAG: protein kinase domain-containing protein [Pirellula sp.]|jgi:serine/threonine protein kinase/formylglycine-generating enzyme required for sulfatase activity